MNVTFSKDTAKGGIWVTVFHKSFCEQPEQERGQIRGDRHTGAVPTSPDAVKSLAFTLLMFLYRPQDVHRGAGMLRLESWQVISENKPHS